MLEIEDLMLLVEKRADRKGDYMSLVRTKGIDISSLNGDVNLRNLKESGYDFAMIRCGFGSDSSYQDDKQFEANVQKCESLGIPWGAYLYSYALNTSDAIDEAKHVIRLLKGKKPTLPIAFDMEDADGWKKSHGMPSDSMLVSICKTFLSEIKKAGYYPMLYASLSWLNNQLNDSSLLNSYDVWVAQWNSECNYLKPYGMWQYGGETNFIESNSIAGIGVVDKNYCYKDYPTIIKSGGYNNWPKSVKKNLSIEVLAFQVLNGEWGNNDARKKAITEAGYDYSKVQTRVNEIVESWNKPTLDKTGYKLLDSNIAILAVKEMLLYARKLGIITQGMSEDKVFGDGTLIAVNEILKKGNYNQNGIIGDNFIKYLSKLINEKLTK